MSAAQMIALTVAALVLIAGGAAVGAADPVEPPQEPPVNDTHDVPTEHDERDNPAANASELDADNAESVGPSDGMPDQAADRVSEIHERIDAFLDGAFEDLGEALSQLLGNGEPSERPASATAG